MPDQFYVEACRYAVYLAPGRDEALARWGAAWLGWDLDAGCDVSRSAITGVPAALQERATNACRKYGFHLTLKAPFRLRAGVTLEELQVKMRAIAYAQPSFEAHFRCTTLSGFVGLRPLVESHLRELSNGFVQGLDALRADLSDEEISRRRPDLLSEQQRSMLLRWGYPYVFNEFRPHYTLTDPLNDTERRRVWEALSLELAETLTEPMPVDHVCLLVQPPGGRFQTLSREPLRGR